MSAVRIVQKQIANEQSQKESVEDHGMTTFPIEFIGGSKDGEVVEATTAPDFCEVIVCERVREIYERQNSEPPFIYVQIGYAGNETWK